MSTLIIDDDPYSRATLRAMLCDAGLGPPLEAQDLQEALPLLECGPEPGKGLARAANLLRLVIAHWSPQHGMDIPLTRNLMECPWLHSVPLILMLQDRLMTDLGGFRKFTRPRERVSRVDSYLFRPFGLAGLREAIRRAFRHRFELRHTISLLGEGYRRDLKAAMLLRSVEGQAGFHWADVQSARTLAELRPKFDENSFRISALLVDPAECGKSELAWLRRFKRTPRGLGTTLACLSRDPALTGKLRLFCDLFLAPPRPGSRSPTELEGERATPGWVSLLEALSERVLGSWQVRYDLGWFRRSLRDGKDRDAGLFLESALRVGGAFWECQLAAGDFLAAKGQPRRAAPHYERALELNPFSARAYMGLLAMEATGLPNLEISRNSLLENAARACPGHPQLQALGGTPCPAPRENV